MMLKSTFRAWFDPMQAKVQIWFDLRHCKPDSTTTAKTGSGE